MKTLFHFFTFSLFLSIANANVTTPTTVDTFGTPLWDASVHHADRRSWHDRAEWVGIPFDDMEQIQIDVPPMPGFSEIWLGGGGLGNYDRCPPELNFFQCQIWRTRPHVRETRYTTSNRLRHNEFNAIMQSIQRGEAFNRNNPAALPLIARYEKLMNASLACCRDGMLHHLAKWGADDALKHKFIFDDANFYMMGQRCLVISDADLDRSMPNVMAAEVMADVRNTCICRSRDWFTALLGPFTQVYNAAPEFRDANFRFQYSDGLQRTITVNINREVQTVLEILRACP
ncbi:MAG: hypothetical protein FWC83_01250 [Alphaproteobacteria bacterium]|nr:hypothetical protein [Alphaproteobacteria bacterium]